MKITKMAKAEWTGDLKEGKGSITLESGAFEGQPYGFNTRFEGKAGTNPEELIGAAHSSCFTMALSKELSEANYKIDSLRTEAHVNLEKTGDAFEIPSIQLKLNASIADIKDDEFQKIANKAKENCPISKLFNAKIGLNATLEQ